MCCRGFDGKIRIMKPLKFGLLEIGFIGVWSALFIVMRFYNIPALLGGAVTELFK
jgi:cobalt/nickel transport system permease protein